MAKTKVITSKQFQINTRDFLKGMILAVGTPVLYALQELIPVWEIDPIYKIAISGLVSYLLKNFFERDRVITVVGKYETIKDTEQNIKRII